MSIASILQTEYKSCNTKTDYINMRHTIRLHGINKFKQEMTNNGFFQDDRITSEMKPFNPFARIIVGKMENPCKDVTNNDDYVILQNRPDNDANWNSDDPAWVGKSSMSKNHKFLSPKLDTWSCFNVLTLGMGKDLSLDEAVDMLNEMKDVAMKYAKQKAWSMNIGLYFHCYPFNSIQTLHLHIVDLDTIGPSFEALAYKNLSLDDVKSCLLDEYIQGETIIYRNLSSDDMINRLFSDI